MANFDHSSTDRNVRMGIDALESSWRRAPEFGCEGDAARIGAAVWSGEASDLAIRPDPDVSMVVIALARYKRELFVDGRYAGCRQMQPGDVQTMVAGVTPRVLLSGSWRALHVYMPQLLIRAAADEVAPGREVRLIDQACEVDAAITDVAYRIVREIGSGMPASRLMLDCYGVELAVKLVRNWSNLRGHAGTARIHRGGLSPLHLQQVCDSMEAQLGKDVELRQLANIVGLCPTHLSRAFKQSTGLTPFAWLLDRRIDRAKAMLAQSDKSLAEIAQEVGFAAQPQFTTAFRRMTGTTPGAWRRERLR